MAWEPDFYDDGDAADAGGLNARLNDLRVWVNDLTRAGLRRGTFNRFHAAQVLKASVNPLSKAYSGNVDMVYNTTTFNPSMTFAAAGANGGSDTAGVFVGDRSVVGHPSCPGYLGGKCELTFDGAGYRLGMTNGDRVAAILLMFNVQTLFINEGAPAPAPPPGQVLRVFFCLQFKSNAAADWRTIDRTERYYGHDAHAISRAAATEKLDFDTSIGCLLVPQDMTDEGFANTNFVTGVRAMVSLVDHGTDAVLTLRRFNLSAWPLHAKEM